MQLSRHDVRRVDEKFSSRRFQEADGCWTHFGLLSPKTFDSNLLDMMCVEFVKNILSPIRARSWPLDSFRLPDPKNVWFLHSRNDVHRVHEKFSSRRFEREIGCWTDLALQSPKTFDSYFLDMMYVEFMKYFLHVDGIEVMSVILNLDSWAQNVWFSMSRHDVRGVDEKFSSRRFERAIGC